MSLFCGLPLEWWKDTGRVINFNREEVVLIRPSSIGDVLFMTPIAKAIKHINPQMKVTVMTRLGELLIRNPDIDSIENSNEESIERCKCQKFFMAYEFDPEMNAVKAYAKRMGLKINNVRPEIFLSEEEKEKGKKIVSEQEIGKFILIHAECDWKSRRWLYEYWLELIGKLKKYNLDIVNVSKHGITTFPGVVNLYGIRNLRRLISIINQAELLITIDSGIMNIGVALGRPVVSIFTITEPEKRLPDEWVKMSVCNEGISRGYHHRRKPIPVEFDITEEEYVRCYPDFRAITPDRVMEKVKGILG